MARPSVIFSNSSSEILVELMLLHWPCDTFAETLRTYRALEAFARAGKAKAIQMDLTDCPDLFPPLATLAAFAKGPSTLKGIHRLTGKESNRATTIQSEWANVGIRVDLDEATDTMTIHPAPIQAGRIETHGDHRLAMAAALFGAAGAPVEIVGAECVAKSYPAFFDDLESLGLVIHTVTA